MMQFPFPFVRAVAEELREGKEFYLRGGDADGIEVRLQVLDGGRWDLHFGDPCYDQDHRGYWGSNYLTRKSNCHDLARELIREVRGDYACSFHHESTHE